MASETIKIKAASGKSFAVPGQFTEAGTTKVISGEETADVDPENTIVIRAFGDGDIVKSTGLAQRLAANTPDYAEAVAAARDDDETTSTSAQAKALATKSTKGI